MIIRNSTNTSGRKYPSKKPYVNYRGEIIPINNGSKHGVHMATLKKSFEQLDCVLDRCKRVLFITFVLWPGSSNETNQIMKKHRERFSYQFSKLGLSSDDYGFHWCRELGKGEKEHYHLAIWINGNKYNKPKTLALLIKKSWEELGGRVGANLNKNWDNRWWLFVDNLQLRLDVLYWLSYWSKSRSKGKKPTQTKEHGMSRLKPRERRSVVLQNNGDNGGRAV